MRTLKEDNKIISEVIESIFYALPHPKIGLSKESDSEIISLSEASFGAGFNECLVKVLTILSDVQDKFYKDERR